MTKPNKTVGEFRRKNPRMVSPEASAEASRRRNPEFWDAMERFQRGEMTAEEFKQKFDRTSK